MPAAANATSLQSVLTQDKKGMVPGVGRRLHGHFASSLGSPGPHVADPRGMLSPQTWQRAEGGLHQELTCWESLHNKDLVALTPPLTMCLQVRNWDPMGTTGPDRPGAASEARMEKCL